MPRPPRASALAATLTLLAACGGGGDPGPTQPPPPPAVGSVSVSLGAAQLIVGSTTTATAQVLATTGAPLAGRTVTWSSGNEAVATVSAAGVVSAVAPGTVNITATSEGRSGSATLTVTPLPIASVTIQGGQRIKVGDTYQYAATARLGDGTVVQRPVTWRVAQPERGAMTASGSLVPSAPGILTVEAVIDGVVWEVDVTVYDWVRQVINGSVFETLAADRAVTNRNGQSEYPELVFVCSSTGNFFMWVSTQRFVTENGIIAFSLDGGQAVAQTWTESSDFSTLFKPGSNATVKVFALQVAAARRFGFAFGEFRGPTHATEFRVSGLSPRLAALFALCPAGTPIASPGSASALAAARADLRSSMQPFGSGDDRLAADRRARAAAGPSSRAPSTAAWSQVVTPALEGLPARRRN